MTTSSPDNRLQEAYQALIQSLQYLKQNRHKLEEEKSKYRNLYWKTSGRVSEIKKELERSEKKIGYSFIVIGLILLFSSISILANQGALASVNPYNPSMLPPHLTIIAIIGAIGMLFITGGLAFSDHVGLALLLVFITVAVCFLGKINFTIMLYIGLGAGFGWWLGLVIPSAVHSILMGKKEKKLREMERDEKYYFCIADLFEDCLLMPAEYGNEIEDALNSFIVNGSIGKAREVFSKISKGCPFKCYRSKEDYKSYPSLDPIKWVRDLYDSLYLNNVEKLRKLVDEAREFLSSDYKRNSLVVSVDGFKSDFYLRLLEYHYLLANTVLLEYSARVPSAVGVGVSVVTAASGGGWDDVLYEGSCRFKFSGVSQWRDGVIRVTGKGIVLEGKLSVKSLNLAMIAVKATARAAGIGEVHERISYDSITSYDYNARKGKVVIEAGGKKYVIKTDAAGHIGSYLDKFVRGS